MNHTARVFQLSSRIRTLNEGERYMEKLGELLHQHFAEVELETRQLVMVDAIAACRERSETVKMAAELIDHTTEAGKLKRQYQFGLANGIADAAGIVGEVIQGRETVDNAAGDNAARRSLSDANHQNQEAGSQETHLAPQESSG